MAEPKDYITATRKNFVSNDNEGRMVEKCIVEIQGTFLVKIHDDAFNMNIGENLFKHINKFLEIVGLIKINGLTQDRFRLSFFPVSLVGAASEWFTKECLGSITTWDNMVENFIMIFHHLSDHDEEEETEEDDNPNETDNVPEIFKIEGNLFDFETPLCVAFYEFNYLLKIDADLFTYDGTTGNGSNMKQEPFPQITGDNFENFHEIDYNVLVKLQECWWKVNAHEISPFTRMEKLRRGPYANKKTEWASNPYLDVNLVFGRDYEARNVGDTQKNQGHKEKNGNPNLEPSNCKIRRFAMMKYSFDDDEDYITIKESEYLNHSKDSLDA
ncbi:hypothetical protein Tco_0222741 [Tanacetum coccineum]